MKKIIISIIVFAIATLSGTLYLKTQKEKDNDMNKEKIIKKKCIPITGGSYHLLLYKNLEEEPESMHVGIACSPSSYLDLPIPEKEGYSFDGWYYDKEYKEKVEVKNTREIKPVPERVDDCIVGYQDISLYAKWTKR